MTDLDARVFYKRNGALHPRDVPAEEFLAGVKEGREITVTVRKPRNPGHHRLLFAILKIVVDNTEQWQTVDRLLDDLKLATDLYDKRINLITGQPYAVARSISFAAMSQDDFKAWFDRVLDLLAREVLHTLPDELERQVFEMAGERR